MQNRYLFVVQHTAPGAGVNNSPSGTLTVLMELIRHWPKDSDVNVLCNKEYANLDLLQQFCSTYGVTLHKFKSFTAQDRIAIARADGSRWSVVRRCLQSLAMPFRNLATLITLRKFLIQNDFRIIYSHNGGYPGGDLNRFTILAGALARVSVNALIIHNLPNPISKRRMLLRPVERISDRMVSAAATHIVSVSESAATALVRQRDFARKVSWIYNGIRTDQRPSSDASKPEWALSPSQPVILFLGALSPRKGIDYLFRAVSQLQVGYQLILYGSGDPQYVDRLEKLAFDVGINSNVVFAGFDSDAADYIYYSDLLVLPSIRFESFGMVLLEAMRHKKPVVCTDVGGMKEVVVDGETGFVVTSRDARSLCVAIEKLLLNPALAREMGESGYIRLQEEFDIRNTVQRYLEIAEK